MTLNLKIQQLFPATRPRLIMFDLDGTLIHSLPDIARSLDVVLTQAGYPAAGQELAARWIGNGVAKLIERALRHVEKDEEKRDALQEKILEDYLRHYSCHVAVDSHCYKGVREVLSRLKKANLCHLAVVTNKPWQMAVDLLRALDLEPFFSDIIGGDSLPQKKPDPAPLLYLMGKYHVDAKDSLMIGDSKSDLMAARNAGCPCICVTYGYHQGEDLEALKPDLLVDSFAELL